MNIDNLHWQEILDEVPQIVIIIDEVDKIVYCNKSALNSLGFSQQELYGTTFSKIVVAASNLKSDLSASAEKQQRLLIGLKSKQGTVQEVVFSNKFFDLHDGKLNYLMQVGKVEKIELGSMAGINPYKDIISAIPDLLFFMDGQFRITHFYSPGNEKLVAPAVFFIGKKPEECLPAEVSNVVMSALKEAKSNGKSLGSVYNIDNGSGIRWFQLSISYTLSGTEDVYIALARDITESKTNELAFIESESRYRAVAENANAGIGVVDNKENLVFVNETFAQMLGYEREQMIGKSLSNFSSSESFELYRQKTSSRRPGMSDIYEAEMLHKNGEKMIFSVSASPLFSPDNQQHIGTVGVLIDITGQKIDAAKLIETSARLQAVLSSMPDMIFIIDKNGVYLDFFINEQLYPWVDPKVLTGATIKTIFEEYQQEMMYNAIHNCLTKQQTQLITYQLTRNGMTDHFEARLSPMNENAVVALVKNITNLVTLENKFQGNQKMLSLLTHLAGRFINLSVSDINTEINNAIAEIGVFASVDRVFVFDFDWENDTCSNTFEWCSPGTSAEIDKLQNVPNTKFVDWVKRIKTGKIVNITSVAALKHDTLKQILESQHTQSSIAIPLMDGSKCLGYVGFDAVRSEKQFSNPEISMLAIFAELITNLKTKNNKDKQLEQSNLIFEKQNMQLLQLNELLKQQNDEIKQKNTELAFATRKAEASSRLKTAFLNNISHEVRTPLNGIVGFAQFIADENMPFEDKQEYVDAMNISVGRLMNTISDILDVSLLMTGNMSLMKDEFLLEDVLNELFKKFEKTAIDKQLEFKILSPANSSTSIVSTDRSFVLKILNELIDNAFKYTSSGHIYFGYDFRGEDVELFVEDTGLGISDEALPDIYEPFTQQDSSTTRAYEGSGLGLTLVRGLVDLIGGTIIVNTKKGEGTRFIIQLPAKRSKQQQIPVSQPPAEQQLPSAIKPKILLAEDEELNILYTKQIFKNRKYELLYAKNGKEAVDIAHNEPDLALILMDIKMPVMDGIEATKLIKAFKPDLPIIAVTAYAGSDHRNICIEAGCDEYISKPFETIEFFELIDRMLNMKETN